MSYRIAFTGAQGTGKSTLAKAVAARLQAGGAGPVRAWLGIGGDVATAGLAVGEQAGAPAVRRFAELHRVREARADADATGGVQVFDRCLLDTLAYADVLGCLDAAEFERLRAAAAASSARCGQLLWLRVTQDYAVLDARDESPAFRRAIDAAIGRLAAASGIALLEHAMPPEPLDAVVEAVLRRCPGAVAS